MPVSVKRFLGGSESVFRPVFNHTTFELSRTLAWLAATGMDALSCRMCIGIHLAHVEILADTPAGEISCKTGFPNSLRVWL